MGAATLQGHDLIVDACKCSNKFRVVCARPGYEPVLTGC